MQKKKFLTAVGLSMLMLATACSNDGGANTQETASPSSTAGKTESPVPDPLAEKLTLNVFNAGGFSPASAMPSREKDTLRQILEKGVNIDLNMTIPPNDQILQVLNTRIASGDIPDLIFFNTRTTAVQYFQDGVTVPITDLVDKYPKLKQRFDTPLWEAMKYKGQIIGVPGTEGVSGVQSWWIQKDWLDAVGLSVPRTTDELLEVMKAFTFNDPDRNGAKDTYGFAAGVNSEGNLATFGWDGIFWLFGVNPQTVDVDAKGQLIFGQTDDRTRAALEFIRKMIDAGVVDPDWVSMGDAKAIDQKMFAGKVGIMRNDFRRMEPSQQKNMSEIGGRVPNWESFAPPKSSNGEQIQGLAAFQNSSWGVSMAAAKDPKKLDRVFRFLEYWYADEEAQPYFSYGLKDVQWTDKNGKIERIDSATLGIKWEEISWTSNYWLPRKANDPLYFNFLNPKTAEFHKLNLENTKPNRVNALIARDEKDTKYVDRQRYINESILNFMIGKTDLSKWDEYIATLKSKFDYETYQQYVQAQLKEIGAIQ